MTEPLWGLDDAMYGLRNLAVGDDEETRIADRIDDVPLDIRATVQEHLASGDYRTAYIAAIWPTLAPLTRDEVAAAITTWASAWEAEACSRDDDYDQQDVDDLAADMLVEYDAIRRVEHLRQLKRPTEGGRPCGSN